MPWKRVFACLGKAAFAATFLLTSGCLERGPAGRHEANGEAYGEISYHLEPDYSCVKDTGERVPSYKSAIRTEANGSVYLLGDVCSKDSPQLLATPMVETSSYYPELTGFGTDIYEKNATAPSPLDEQLYFVEAWCRVEGATAQNGFDISVHYSLYDRVPRVRFRKSASFTPDIPSNAFNWERGANRIETDERVLYEMEVAGTTKLALTVEWNRPIEQQTKFEGTLKNLTTGSSHPMRCRAVSTLKNFVQRMAKIGELKGIPPVPATGGTFFEYNQARTCRKADGSTIRGYSSAIVRGEEGPKEVLPSYCRSTGAASAVDTSQIETSSYNPRYLGYGPKIYEYRPPSAGADFGYGDVALIWCRTNGATATRGMDLVLLFRLRSEDRVFRFSSDGYTKAELSDQWYVGHRVESGPITRSEGLVTIRNLLPWRDIKLDISTTSLSATDRRYPAVLEAMTQNKRSRQEMTCRVSTDIIAE